MSDDEQNKTKEPPSSAARAGASSEGQPYVTADVALGITEAEGERNPRLSQSPGLVAVPSSMAPAMADGTLVPHVYGPGQNPVDPIAAGLDLGYIPKTRHEMRAPTLTGELGSGPTPATYAEKTAEVAHPSQSGETVKQPVELPAPETQAKVEPIETAADPEKPTT